MSAGVSRYFLVGCGRCPLGDTTGCKVHTWQCEMAFLRSIIIDSGLQEALKRKVPCHTHHKSNVLLLAAFKEYRALSFFKVALLKDEHGLLQNPGEYTRTVKPFKFNNLKQEVRLENHIKNYIREAIELENAG